MAQVKEFSLPDELYYDTKEHIWARREDGRVRLGLDAFAACAAGTVAYIKLLPAGREVKKGRAFGSLEAGKYIGPLKAPVSGRIQDRNEEVLANPRLVNTDHYDQGWFVVLEPTSLEEDLRDLVHGPAVQPWLEKELAEYETKGMIKKEAERQCV